MEFAHSRNDQGKRHDLIAHLRGVAELARQFAAEFGAAEPAYFLGLWHDIGKFNPAFQSYLLRCEAEPTTFLRGPDHKAAGTLLAADHLKLAALLVQGHHGGLKMPVELQAWLAEKSRDPATAEALECARVVLPDLEPGARPHLPEQVLRDARAAEFFLRFLYSALVDADFLDTERHFSQQIAAQRGSDVGFEELWTRFEADQNRFSGQPENAVSQARQAIYEACLKAADLPPGLFRLAVPTGGGKTRSAMAFALRHGLRYGHRRVVVAVPFISITEQTADVYRGIFQSPNDLRPAVIEHHSGAAVSGEDTDDFNLANKLGCENWDAPVIVTTTVQLFESLFANGPSRTRKVHRLAHSVIILDEAQALPAHLLEPILDALREVCSHYGATVVISTATQPAFEAIPPFASLPATEIVPNPVRFFNVLRRVRYEWRTDHGLSWAEAAQILQAEPQCLAVLNTKKDALALLDALDDPEALHLSTLLCGAHRRRVIKVVQRRLQTGEPCRLVSTQVIEAGVDLDFPMVMRAVGPLDGLIQAAGRCNREGRLNRGRVVIFRPEEGGMPPGLYRTASHITEALLGRDDLDPDNPEHSREYFKQLFETINTDRESIQLLRAELNYPEVARRFRMIDEFTESVTVAYGDEEERELVQTALERLRRGAPEARLRLRQLQPYLVSARTNQADRYRRMGLISPVIEGIGEWCGDYDAVRGLRDKNIDPESLVI